MPDLHQPQSSPPTYEKGDANLRTILIFGVGLIILTIVILLLMWSMFRFFAVRESRLDRPAFPLADTRQAHSQPRLQVTPVQDLDGLRVREEGLLNSYSWINKEAGVIRIPIDRAIELLVEKPLPVRQEANGQTREQMGK